MEAVDQFDIDIDIEDRQRLYDYTTSKIIQRPESGKWKPGGFRGLGSKSNVSPEDKKAVARVSLMDKAIADKSCLEKTKTEDHTVNLDFESVESESLPRRVLPVYKPGEMVSGTLTLRLNKAVKAESLCLSFRGQAFVNIRVYHKYGYFDIQGKEKYVKDSITLWEKTKKGDEKEGLDKYNILNNNIGSDNTELSVGVHSFPFSFVIPSDARQSTPPLIPRNDYRGFIVYRLRAVIKRHKCLPSCNLNSHKGIWVETPSDIALDPTNFLPASQEDVLNTGLAWNPKKITARATVPHAGVLIGAPVPLTLEVYNQSSGTIDEIQAYIRMTGRARVSEKRLAASWGIHIKSKKEGTKEVVNAGASYTFKWDIPWDFTDTKFDGNLLPVGTLDDCKLLKVKYDVTVNLVRKGPRQNLKFRVPIFVGNMNSDKECVEGEQCATERVFYQSENTGD